MGLNPGQTIGNGEYTIIEESQRTSISITYQVTHKDDAENHWAIKILDPQVLKNLPEEERDDLEEMFWFEAVKLALCQDTPHIIQIKPPFKEEDIICWPMEYLPGPSLEKRERRILPEKEALEYIRQVGEALAVMHSQGLVHKDIRPANIVRRMKNPSEVVLTNVGTRKDLELALITRSNKQMDGFSPIELYVSEIPITPRTDVYSLAATLYNLLTDEVPVSARKRVVNVPLESPQSKKPDISGSTTKAILAGMQLKPEDRPSSVIDFLDQLVLKNTEGVDTDEGTDTKVKMLSTSTNWDKWGVIWTAVGSIAAIVGLLLGIPALINWLKSEPDTQSKEIFMHDTTTQSLHQRH